MIKGKTALSVYIEFVEKNGREPEKDEFMDLGYKSKTTFYKAKKDYKEMKDSE